MTKIANRISIYINKMKILDILFPKKCEYCNKLDYTYICPSCFSKISNRHISIKTAKSNLYDYIIYLCEYKGEERNKMLDFKFHDKAYLAEYFIELIKSNKNISYFLKQFDIIVPVPMNKNKKLKRGYNQTELLAKHLSNKIEIPISNCLINPLKKEVQSLLSKKERFENVKNVFKLQSNYNISYKNIILLDDIFTTGATIESCAKELKNGGANKICAFIIAKSVL